MLNPNIPWLESIQIAEEMRKRVKVPTFIMHEEKALCRAQFQSLDDSSSYITLDFSSGVGMSVVENGNYLKGKSGFAGEIGHVVLRPDGKLCGCGNRGCLETIASDRVFQQDLNLSMTESLLELKKGTKRSFSVAENVMKAQASGIAMVITMLNPEVLFTHSRLAKVYPNYLKRIQEETQKQTLSLSYKDCSIQIAKEGKVRGAIYLTIDQLIGQSI
jgi:N-acetylglucosamine repressor